MIDIEQVNVGYDDITEATIFRCSKEQPLWKLLKCLKINCHKEFFFDEVVGR